MTIEPSDPPRIIDEDPPEALLELVRAKRRRGPSDATMRRLSERFEAAGLLARPAPDVTVASRVETKLTWYKHGLVAVAVASGLVFSWRAMQAPPAPGIASAVPSRVEVTEPALQTTDPDQARPAVDDTPAPAVLSVEDLPRAPETSASAVARAAIPTSPKQAARPEPTSERAPSREVPSELEIIQTALRTDPERALAATHEHERIYPSGELLQEREVLAVEALSRLGRKEEALRRARSLVQRFARTPYASRLETAVGQPLTPESGRARSIDRDEPASSPVTTTH